MVTTPNFTDGTWRIVSTGHHGGTPNGDILWQNVLDQSLVLWRQDGGTTVSKSTLPGLEGYEAVATGDFDGDGVEDVFLRNETTDDNQIIFGGSNSRENTANSLWVPEAATDLDGDGKDDVILLSADSSTIGARIMDGATVVSQTNFASGYTTGDQLLAVFDGVDEDSFTSLWFNSSTSEYEITSYFNGARFVSDTFTVGSGKEYVGHGDFDGDGQTDFFFRDQAGFGEGSIEVVFNNVDDVRAIYDVGTFTNLEFAAAGDFDDDGTAEVLARNPVTGETTVMQVIGGRPLPDGLTGSDSDDLIDGREGNDDLYAGDGDDVVLGDDGNDFILAGDGDDRADGGLGNDSLFGGEGEDSLKGASGHDDIVGGAADDTLEAGNGTDILFGGDGDDYLVGGGFGFSHIRGGSGDDIIEGKSSEALLEGNDGRDVIYGGSRDDLIRGGDGDDYLVGGANEDTIYGGAGDDIIVGTDRDGASGTSDVAYGGSGSDTFYLGNNEGNYYVGSGELTIKDYDAFGSETDFLMLRGLAGNYDFVDTGSTIEVRQASDGDVLAVIETTATTAQVEATAIYMG